VGQIHVGVTTCSGLMVGAPSWSFGSYEGWQGSWRAKRLLLSREWLFHGYISGTFEKLQNL